MAANQGPQDMQDASALLLDRSPSWTFKIEGRLLDVPLLLHFLLANLNY